MNVTPIDSVPPNTAAAELGEKLTTAEAAKSTIPLVPTEVFFGNSTSQSLPSEGTTKPDHIMDDIAVFFATLPLPSLASNGILHPEHSSSDHNQGSLAVANFATWIYQS